MRHEKNEQPAAPELRRLWHYTCQGYLRLFCRKHGYDYAAACVSWIGDIGQYVTVGDFVIDLDTIRADIDFEAPKTAFLQWYDECSQAHHEGKRYPAYWVWLESRQTVK